MSGTGLLILLTGLIILSGVFLTFSWQRYLQGRPRKQLSKEQHKAKSQRAH